MVKNGNGCKSAQNSLVAATFKKANTYVFNLEEMGSLVFTRDRQGRVSGFVIRSGKVKNLRFDKIK